MEIAMAYRTINVDGTEYEYTVGRTHLKVKGVGVAAIGEVGKSGRNPYDHHSTLGLNNTDVMVTPGDVSKWIRDNIHK
jgi:hypothetical protein